MSTDVALDTTIVRSLNVLNLKKTDKFRALS
jgi:hypothetical protein